MKVIAVNKKAHFDYEIIRKFEAGISLLGSEVKSLREGKVNLKEAYIGIRALEAFMFNSNISLYSNASCNNHEPKRKRKLLLHKQEIKKLDRSANIKGYAIVPLKIYFNKKGLVKVEIALVKGKREYQKKQIIKEKDIKRDMERELKFFK